jgi:hypothetical protein
MSVERDEGGFLLSRYRASFIVLTISYPGRQANPPSCTLRGRLDRIQTTW